MKAISTFGTGKWRGYDQWLAQKKRQPRPELLSITGIHCCVHIRNGALQREARRAPCRTQVISCGNLILCDCQSDFLKVLNRPPRQNILSPIIRFTKPDNRTQNPIIRLVETGWWKKKNGKKKILFAQDLESRSPLGTDWMAYDRRGPLKKSNTKQYQPYCTEARAALEVVNILSFVLYLRPPKIKVKVQWSHRRK